MKRITEYDMRWHERVGTLRTEIRGREEPRKKLEMSPPQISLCKYRYTDVFMVAYSLAALRTSDSLMVAILKNHVLHFYALNGNVVMASFGDMEPEDHCGNLG